MEEVQSVAAAAPAPQLNGARAMRQNGKSRLPEIVAKHEADLLAEWVKEQLSDIGARKSGALREPELRDQCREFLDHMKTAVQDGELGDIQAPRFSGLREMLTNLSRTRA